MLSCLLSRETVHDECAGGWLPAATTVCWQAVPQEGAHCLCRLPVSADEGPSALQEEEAALGSLRRLKEGLPPSGDATEPLLGGAPRL